MKISAPRLLGLRPEGIERRVVEKTLRAERRVDLDAVEAELVHREAQHLGAALRPLHRGRADADEAFWVGIGDFGDAAVHRLGQPHGVGLVEMVRHETDPRREHLRRRRRASPYRRCGSPSRRGRGGAARRSGAPPRLTRLPSAAVSMARPGRSPASRRCIRLGGRTWAWMSSGPGWSFRMRSFTCARPLRSRTAFPALRAGMPPPIVYQKTAEANVCIDQAKGFRKGVKGRMP